MKIGPARRVLISGATGVVGAALVGELLSRLPGEIEIVCLSRSHASLDELLAELGPGAERVRAACCDLSSGEGMDEAAAGLARAQITVGVHCAADVAWDKPLAEVHDLNVSGSVRFTELLTATSEDPRLIYVSSAYTAPDDWHYRNAYEESKAAGEREVRARFPAMPNATFSCSLVIGRQSDGAIRRFHGLYPLIKLMALMRPPFLVGDATCLIDLVPVDWVGAELAAHTCRALAQASTAPVTAAAGPRRISTGSMISCIEQRINRFRARHGLDDVPPLVFLPYRRWAFLRRSLERWQPAELPVRDFRYFERLLQIYRPYAESATVLPPRNVRREAPEAMPILAKAVDYWLDRNERLVLARAQDDRAPRFGLPRTVEKIA
jgi:nucleoside-diphosphate-sugar epimerase